MLSAQPIGPKRERALIFFGRMVAGVYLTLAILGLLLTGLTPLTDVEGDVIAVLAVNPLTNLIHLAVGLVAVPAAERPQWAQRLALLVGVLMVIWALLGFALDGSTADIFASNFETAALHLVTGLVALGLAVGVPRRAPAAGAA